MTEVLDRITKKMKEEKITARELSNKLDINETNITQWKKGKKGYLQHIDKIAAILKTSTDYLLSGKTDEAAKYYEAICKASPRDRKIIDLILGFEGCSESVTTEL